jgi:hypothetical protein
VLVHGAFADGSSWNKVIPLLENAGLNVVAVQNSLDSLDGDVAVTNRAIAAAQGSVVRGRRGQGSDHFATTATRSGKTLARDYS